jgi:hypothetical protein
MQIVKTSDDKNREHQIRVDDFRVIARQRKPGDWEIDPSCPFQDSANPLHYVRRAVEDGQMIMAQRRLGPGQYDLLLKPARHRR